VRGYCEVHIEQGPELEAAGIPVGVVDAITGIHRATLTVTGVAGHAGTVPMSLRHDALAAAAEFILAVEHAVQDRDGLVATVGRIDVQPGASNVIAGRATVSLDLRHPDDDVREELYRSLQTQTGAIARRRGVIVEWDLLGILPATPCAQPIIATLAGAIEDSGYPVRHLVSGAGHDGSSMAHLAPVGMLFVRCLQEISPNPAESISATDATAVITVLMRFLALLASPETAP
jgi:allantoate deiminase